MSEFEPRESASRTQVLKHCTFLFFQCKILHRSLVPVLVNELNSSLTYCLTCNLWESKYSWHHIDIYSYFNILRWQNNLANSDSLKKNSSVEKLCTLLKNRRSHVCNGHREWNAWHLPSPSFFQLEGSLQMEKSSPITSLSETEYDEKTVRPSPEASRAMSSFRPSQEPEETD